MDDALLTAFGDDMHVALREVARSGPIARIPTTGVVIVLRHADLYAVSWRQVLGRSPESLPVVFEG